jgi:hypothetical protein
MLRILSTLTLAAIFLTGKAGCVNFELDPVVTTFPDSANYPGNFAAKDFYGSSLDINDDYFFVAAPGAHSAAEPAKTASGAVYVYHKEHGAWVLLQIITTGGTGDHLGGASVRSEGEWLFVSAFGTPIGDADHADLLSQDFSGSIRIYKLNCSNEQPVWELSQIFNRDNTPSLADLSSRIFTDPSDPTVTEQSGALFGSSLSLDVKKGWALVGAQGQNVNNVKEAGAAYFFTLDKHNDTWLLVQKVTSPEGNSELDNFGAIVEINNGWAFISNGDLQSHAAGRLANSKVWAYKRQGNQWNYVQTLTSSQPQELSNALGFFDAFGNSLSIGDKWAVVGAPLDSTGGRAMGAAYVFKLQGNKWALKQTLYSDEAFDPAKPGHMVGYLNGVRIDNETLVVGDPGRSGPHGEIHQGAFHVYKLNGIWKKRALVYDPNGHDHDFFGVGVAVKGKFFLGGTLSALDFAYPNFMPPVDRAFVEIAPGVTVPVISDGKAVLFKK